MSHIETTREKVRHLKASITVAWQSGNLKAVKKYRDELLALYENNND